MAEAEGLPTEASRRHLRVPVALVPVRVARSTEQCKQVRQPEEAASEYTTEEDRVTQDAGLLALGECDLGEVVLVRHGATEWSVSGRHTGRTNVPLNDLGRRQASAVGRFLAAGRFARVMSSPLTRALDTCRLAGFGEGASPVEDLREWDYGEYEGLTTPEIRQAAPEWNLWADGCPGGERAADVGTRVDRVIAAVRAASSTTLVFAHGHVLRVLGARWVGLPPERGSALLLEASGICLLTHERDVPVIGLWNLRVDPDA